MWRQQTGTIVERSRDNKNSVALFGFYSILCKSYRICLVRCIGLWRLILTPDFKLFSVDLGSSWRKCDSGHRQCEKYFIFGCKAHDFDKSRWNVLGNLILRDKSLPIHLLLGLHTLISGFFGAMFRSVLKNKKTKMKNQQLVQKRRRVKEFFHCRL